METNCPKAEDTLTWMDVIWKEVTHEYTEKITAGSEIKIELLLFQGFMAEIDMIDDVNTLYYAMRIVHPFAKHIVAVFRLPGKNFVKFQKRVWWQWIWYCMTHAIGHEIGWNIP